MKLTIENFIKVGLIAILAIAAARMAADKLGIAGLQELVG